jgi:hypothetical protein
MSLRDEKEWTSSAHVFDVHEAVQSLIQASIFVGAWLEVRWWDCAYWSVHHFTALVTMMMESDLAEVRICIWRKSIKCVRCSAILAVSYCDDLSCTSCLMGSSHIPYENTGSIRIHVARSTIVYGNNANSLKLCSLSPQENYTHRATSACRRS